MNAAQKVTLDQLHLQRKAGKINRISAGERVGTEMMRVFIDGRKWNLHLDGTMSTVIELNRGVVLTTSEVEGSILPGAPIIKLEHAINKLISDGDEQKLDFDRVHINFRIYGERRWNPLEELDESSS